MEEEILLTKQKIQKHIQSIERRYRVYKEEDPEDASIYIYKKSSNKKNYVGKIEAWRLTADLYMVEDVRCKTKGMGKYLYYMLMDLVHPCGIVSDRYDLSDRALRIWKAFEVVDYVDTGTYKDVEPKKNSSVGNYNKTAKFSLK